MFAVLAMSKLMKSSTLEHGMEGVRVAMTLSSDAHTALSEAIRSNWRDHSLAEAALVSSTFLLIPHDVHHIC